MQDKWARRAKKLTAGDDSYQEETHGPRCCGSWLQHTHKHEHAHTHTQMNWNAELKWIVFFDPPKNDRILLAVGFFFSVFIHVEVLLSTTLYHAKLSGQVFRWVWGCRKLCFFFHVIFWPPKFSFSYILMFCPLTSSLMIGWSLRWGTQDVCCWGFFCAIFANVNIMHSTTLSHAKLK